MVVGLRVVIGKQMPTLLGSLWGLKRKSGGRKKKRKEEKNGPGILTHRVSLARLCFSFSVHVEIVWYEELR